MSPWNIRGIVLKSKMEKNVACIFGSFNPIHKGHLHLGDKIISEIDHIDEIWYVVSPHNPHKEKSDLLDENIRLEMINLSLEGNDKFKSCDIEFKMDRPSYTHKTLKLLSEKYNDHNFHIVMGTDVINNITSWENYEYVINHPIIHFTRDNEDIKLDIHIDLDLNLITLPSDISLSSTYIRNKIKGDEIEELDGLINNEVLNFIITNKHYK